MSGLCVPSLAMLLVAGCVATHPASDDGGVADASDHGLELCDTDTEHLSALLGGAEPPTSGRFREPPRPDPDDPRMRTLAVRFDREQFGVTTWATEGETVSFSALLQVSESWESGRDVHLWAFVDGIPAPQDGEIRRTVTVDPSTNAVDVPMILPPDSLRRGRNTLHVLTRWADGPWLTVGPFLVLYGGLEPLSELEPRGDVQPRLPDGGTYAAFSDGRSLVGFIEPPTTPLDVRLGFRSSAETTSCQPGTERIAMAMFVDHEWHPLTHDEPVVMVDVAAGTQAVVDLTLDTLPDGGSHVVHIVQLSGIGALLQDASLRPLVWGRGDFVLTSFAWRDEAGGS